MNIKNLTHVLNLQEVKNAADDMVNNDYQWTNESDKVTKYQWIYPMPGMISEELGSGFFKMTAFKPNNEPKGQKYYGAIIEITNSDKLNKNYKYCFSKLLAIWKNDKLIDAMQFSDDVNQCGEYADKYIQEFFSNASV